MFTQIKAMHLKLIINLLSHYIQLTLQIVKSFILPYSFWLISLFLQIFCTIKNKFSKEKKLAQN